jgi:transposase
MNWPARHKRDFDSLTKRRLKAARLFDQGHQPAVVARRLEVSRQSASRWHAAYRQQGADGLRGAGRAGRKPKLSPGQLQDLERGLRQGPQRLGYDTPLWTAPRIADLIQGQTGVRFHPDHVYRLLQKLGWSCQRPVGRALERDEQAIRRWKRDRWPDIKKKRSAKGS